MEITIGKIVDFLSARLLEAMKNPAVFKPWSWALYRTWEWANENEKERDIRGLLEDGNDTNRV